MTKVLLIDDHSLFRESLSRLLSADHDLNVVGNFPSISEALSVLATTPVDVVLLDFDLGERQGLEFIEKSRQNGYTGKILMVTAGMSEHDTLRAVQLGASGIFLKHSPPAELLQAIRRVLEGGTWFEPSTVQSLANAAKDAKEAATAGQRLNSREKDVLLGVFEGLANKEIAARLEISEGYVKAVLQQLFDKTGVRTRSQLVRIVLENKSHYGIAL
jgi:DNA-binding NarL/FixJ family response regulator